MLCITMFSGCETYVKLFDILKARIDGTEVTDTESGKDNVDVKKGGKKQDKVSVSDDDMVEMGFAALQATDEIKDRMNEGMGIISTGDTVVIDDSECLIYAVGTGNEDNFIREFLYAFSPDTYERYYYDEENDKWDVLGMG